MAADALRDYGDPEANPNGTVSRGGIRPGWWFAWCLQWSAAVVIVLHVAGFYS
jgi:hypothetical protein